MESQDFYNQQTLCLSRCPMFEVAACERPFVTSEWTIWRVRNVVERRETGVLLTLACPVQMSRET